MSLLLAWLCSASFHVALERGGIGFGHLASLPALPVVQRLDGMSLVEMEHQVELRGQVRAKVVADALALRTIDHPDGSLQAFCGEELRGLILRAQGQQEVGKSAFLSAIA